MCMPVLIAEEERTHGACHHMCAGTSWHISSPSESFRRADAHRHGSSCAAVRMPLAQAHARFLRGRQANAQCVSRRVRLHMPLMMPFLRADAEQMHGVCSSTDPPSEWKQLRHACVPQHVREHMPACSRTGTNLKHVPLQVREHGPALRAQARRTSWCPAACASAHAHSRSGRQAITLSVWLL
jgi:hypothetical protein